jgi:hypothetical protein
MQRCLPGQRSGDPGLSFSGQMSRPAELRADRNTLSCSAQPGSRIEHVAHFPSTSHTHRGSALIRLRVFAWPAPLLSQVLLSPHHPRTDRYCLCSSVSLPEPQNVQELCAPPTFSISWPSRRAPVCAQAAEYDIPGSARRLASCTASYARLASDR